MQICCSLKHLRRLVGVSAAQSTHTGLGRHYDGFETCVLFHSIFLSHTLFSQRCCAVSHAGKVPFPSISGRLQRSIIREINGTGPISCLVPFESAKLLRTSKKMSQFIWDLSSSLCKCQTHTTNPMSLLTKLKLAHSRTHITDTVSWSSFLAQEKQSEYDTKHG